jgi:hypothetical protein
MRALIGVALLGTLIAVPSCTIRHSRTLDNSAPTTVRRVSASSTGLEVFGIQVNDTASASTLLEQAGSGCKAFRNVEVDYRSTALFFVSIPRLTVSASCL